jgi:hypothetical protein
MRNLDSILIVISEHSDVGAWLVISKPQLDKTKNKIKNYFKVYI